MPGLLIAEAQVVAAEAEFDGVAHWRPADDLDAGPIAKAHLEQSTAKVCIAPNGKYASPAPHAQLVQAAGFGGTAMIASRKITGLLHTSHSRNPTGR